VPDEREPLDSERGEEADVVTHVIIDAADAGVIAREPEAGVVWHDEPEALGERKEAVEALDRSAAVQEHERVSGTGGEHRCVDVADDEMRQFEVPQRDPDSIRITVPPATVRSAVACHHAPCGPALSFFPTI
jgi:hypothetical protein